MAPAVHSRLPQVLLILVFLLAQAACGSPSTGESDASTSDAGGIQNGDASAEVAAARQTPATQAMIRELERLHRESLARPRAYYYLNTERAERIKQEANGRPTPALRRALAVELLNAGETESAIEHLEGLLDETGGTSSPLTRDRVDLIELLAISYLRLGEQENCIAHPAAASCIIPFTADAVHHRREGASRAAELYTRLLERRPSDFDSRWLLNIAYMALGEYPADVPPEYVIPGLDRQSAETAPYSSEGPVPSPSTAAPPRQSAETARSNSTAAATRQWKAAVPRFTNRAVDLGVAFEDLAGGVAVEDFDGDGHLDLLTTGHRLNDPVRLLVNDGNGGFVDRSRQAGLDGIGGGLNLVHADYDNDGHQDVFILRGGWLGEAGRHPNSLLKNNGDGTFQDVTEEAGLLDYHPSQTAAFRDFNNDGWLDLFVGNEHSDRWLAAWQDASSDVAADDVAHPSRLYRNNGDGTFTDVAQEVGVDVVAFVKGSAWGDVDNDGYPDLYLSIMGSPNRLFMNRGRRDSGGRQFEEVSAGVHQPFFSFPTWFFDVDNDGWEDLFVSGYDLRRINAVAADVAREYLGRPVDTELPRLYRNTGDGTFVDRTVEAGLDKVVFAMGANFGDIDNDGYLDIYLGTGAPDLRSIVPNRMFRNVDGRHYEEVTLAGGFGHLQKGHGIGFGDLDSDGDQDIYESIGGVYEGDGYGNVLFENPGLSEDRAWVTLRLEGRRSNRSAIGARIRVTTREADGTVREIHRTVSTGGSFGSSSLQQEIGLGRAERIEEVRVTWPNADQTVEVFTDLRVNRYYEIVEGRGEATAVRDP